jgi:hypothetical protein
MPKDEIEEDDPMELVGVALPYGDPDELACSIVEEFIRLGLTNQEILQLFREPFYAGAHAIWKRRGEEYVKSLVDRGRERWGFHRFTSEE